MLTNTCQLMSVRIPQIGYIKVRAVSGSCARRAFIHSSRKEASCMEASDEFRTIGFECEQGPVPAVAE